MKTQTPLDKLIADKQLLEEQRLEQEQKLNENFRYIQDHSGRLLLSGVSTLLFPNTKSTKKEADNESISTQTVLAPSAFSAFVPIVWDIAKPLLISWGIERARKSLVSWLFGKKKKR
ncbi:hypothetical protein FACS189411_05500 [Bacteroidia bacterium]|nr:hypothetical protein FACS189411_05500 [Bacteroidia bacterium]